MSSNLADKDVEESNSGRPLTTVLRYVGRRGVLTMAVVAALTGAIVLTTVKPPANAAERPVDVTWNAGDVSWGFVSDGRCITTQLVTISTGSNEEANQVATVLRDMGSKNDFPSDTGIQDAHVNVSSVGPNDTTVSGVMHAYLPPEKCGTANSAQQALFQTEGGGKLDRIQLAAAPTWLKGAIAAVVGAAVYVAVSALVTAGITATGVLVGASAAVVASVTALSGCIGGASSTAVTLMLAGAGGGWKQNLSNAAAGCVTGASIALLPIAKVGQAAGNAIRGAFGLAPAVVGDAGVAAAATAGVELTGITEVVSVAADSLVAVQ